MTHISPAQVVLDVREYEIAVGRTLDCDVKKLAAAMAILARFFGGGWPQARLLPETGKRSAFLHPPILGPLDQFKTQSRIIDLAEHLVNLQETEGFASCLKEIQRDSIEAGLAKLVAGGMLRRRNIPFRFVVASGRKGHDYDAEAIIGAATVAVEMKAKVAGKAPTEAGIARSLKRARGQLPKNTPTVVFIRVPEAWGKAEAGRIAMAAGVLKEFRDSSTIGLVVIHWEKWKLLSTPAGASGAERGDRLLVLVNTTARVELTALQTALQDDVDAMDLPWLSLHALVCPEAPGASTPQRAPDTGFDLENLTILGSAVLKYAHFCARSFPDPILPTWERVRQIIYLPIGAAEKLPPDSTLVFKLEERGYREGPRDLKVFFFKQGAASDAFAVRETKLEFVQLEKGLPRVAHATLDVGSWDIDGPGIYSFDFVIGEQIVGRLPIAVYTEALPSDLVERGPLRGDFVSLEYGHVVERLVVPEGEDIEASLTFQNVIPAFQLPEPVPFVFNPSVLVFGLSSSQGVAAAHVVTVLPRDGHGEALIPEVSINVVLQPRLPGELFFTVGLQLSEGLVYPGPGDYEFLIAVDGRKVGRVDLPIRAVLRPGPEMPSSLG